MNKPVHLGMQILDISKILMYEFWYDYIKPKYQDKAIMIMTTLLFLLKLHIFRKLFLTALKNGLTHLTIVTANDRFQLVKTKK